MKSGSTFFTIFVGLFLLSLVHFYGKEDPEKHIEGCSETDTIKTTSAYSFTYCKDNDKVLSRDSTWISPSKYQKRWIETKKIN